MWVLTTIYSLESNSHTLLYGARQNVFHTHMCSVCHSAHFKMAFQFLPGTLQKMPFSFSVFTGAICIQSLNLIKVIDTGRMWTSSFTNLHRKKSKRGHLVIAEVWQWTHAWPNHSLGNYLSRKVFTFLWLCGGCLVSENMWFFFK
jgi:hypothetical protein